MPAAIRGGHVDTWEDSKVVPSSHLKLCTETDNCAGDYKHTHTHTYTHTYTKHARACARTHTYTHTPHSLLNISTLARTRRKRCCGEGCEGSKRELLYAALQPGCCLTLEWGRESDSGQENSPSFSWWDECALVYTISAPSKYSKTDFFCQRAQPCLKSCLKYGWGSDSNILKRVASWQTRKHSNFSRVKNLLSMLLCNAPLFYHITFPHAQRPGLLKSVLFYSGMVFGRAIFRYTKHFCGWARASSASSPSEFADGCTKCSREANWFFSIQSTSSYVCSTSGRYTRIYGTHTHTHKRTHQSTYITTFKPMRPPCWCSSSPTGTHRTTRSIYWSFCGPRPSWRQKFAWEHIFFRKMRVPYSSLMLLHGHYDIQKHTHTHTHTHTHIQNAFWNITS